VRPFDTGRIQSGKADGKTRPAEDIDNGNSFDFFKSVSQYGQYFFHNKTFTFLLF
jgi:hypothetical protein